MSKEILEQINQLRKKHEDDYINTIHTIIDIERNIKVYMHQHHGCELQNTQDLRFQFITSENIQQKTQTGQIIQPQILIDNGGDHTSPIVLAGADGSLISKRGRTICTAAAFFGDASPLNAAVVVPMYGNTTIAESYAIKTTQRQRQ